MIKTPPMEQVIFPAPPADRNRERWPDRAFAVLFYLFLFVSVFLPSGSLYHVNFKYPLYLGLLPFAAWHLFYRRGVTRYQLIAAICVLVLLLFWVLLGVGYGFPVASVLRQCTDVFLIFLVCSIIAIFVGDNAKRRRGFLLLVLFAVVATALLKAALIAYSILTGTPLLQLLLLLNRIFDVDLMTMDINDLLGRVQFYTDFLIPVCLFMILRFREELRLRTLVASCIIVLLFGSALLSFSRFIWAFSVLGFLLGLVLSKRDRFKAVLILLVGISIVGSLPLLIQVYKLRFSASVIDSSDSARTEQAGPLKQLFVDAPFFGHGFGSYTTTLLRSSTEAQRFSYELQLLAFVGQVGLIGSAALLFAAFLYFRPLWQPGQGSDSLRDRFGFCILLLFWIGAGLTNPLLFQTVAAVNYAVLQNLARLARTNSSRSMLQG